MKDEIYGNQLLDINEIMIVKIIGDGYCFYRYLSYFFSLNENNYISIKNLIFVRIKNNFETYIIFMETMIHVAQNYPFPSLIKILRKITTLYIKCNFLYSSECYVLAFKAFVNVMP